MASGATRRTSRITRRTSRTGSAGGSGNRNIALPVIGAFIAVILVLVVGFVGQRLFFSSELNKANQTQTVVAAASNLKRGQILSQKDLKLKQVKEAEPQSFRTLEEPGLIGSTLTSDVAEGQTITKNFLAGGGQVAPKAPSKLPTRPGEAEVNFMITEQDRQPFVTLGQVVSLYSVFTTPSGNFITKSVSKNSRIIAIDDSQVGLPSNKKGDPVILVTVATSPDDAKDIQGESSTGKSIKLLDGPNQNPPPSTASIIQEFLGVEMDEKEVTAKVGNVLAAKARAQQSK